MISILSLINRKIKAELERRVESAKSPQPETEKIQVRIQDLAKEIELLKQKVSNVCIFDYQQYFIHISTDLVALTFCHCPRFPKQADDSMQNRVSQLTDTLDNIKTDAGEGKPSDAAQQTPDKAPVAASASGIPGRQEFNMP